MLNICKDCKHFYPIDSDFGVCHRYPPKQSGQFVESAYPRVESSLIACGEFDEKKADPVPPTHKQNKPNNTNQRRKK